MKETVEKVKDCFLCEGYGYIHLQMGGSETCLNCQGKGTAEEPFKK